MAIEIIEVTKPKEKRTFASMNAKPGDLFWYDGHVCVTTDEYSHAMQHTTCVSLDDGVTLLIKNGVRECADKDFTLIIGAKLVLPNTQQKGN